MAMLLAALGPNTNGLLRVPAPPMPGPVVISTISLPMVFELRVAASSNEAERVEVPPAQDQVPPLVEPLPVKPTSTVTALPNADPVKNNTLRATIEGSNLFTYIVSCPFIEKINASRESRGASAEVLLRERASTILRTNPTMHR